MLFVGCKSGEIGDLPQPAGEPAGDAIVDMEGSGGGTAGGAGGNGVEPTGTGGSPGGASGAGGNQLNDPCYLTGLCQGGSGGASVGGASGGGAGGMMVAPGGTGGNNGTGGRIAAGTGGNNGYGGAIGNTGTGGSNGYGGASGTGGRIAAGTGGNSGYGGTIGTGGSDGTGGVSGTGGNDGPHAPKELDCSRPSVGVSPLRRLTQSQYVHAIRDLLGVTAGVADLVPQDGRLGVFRSNATASVGPLDVQQYREAAETIVGRAPMINALVACDLAKQGATACASRFITAFGLRVHRRPLDPSEQMDYESLFAAVGGAGNYASGLSAVVQAMIQSPAFLYQPEFGAAPAVPGAAPVLLTPYELASRLSFLLWDSVPDQGLLDAAGQNGLATAAQITAQAQRLLADPRAADAIGTFHEQWLGLDDMAGLQKDPQLYPSFSAPMVTEMHDETLRFVDYVVRVGDGKLATLLTAPYSFPGPTVRGVYGLSPLGGPVAATPVALDPATRAGFLTQPAFLAVHAHANQSAPVLRGKAIRVNLLCDPPTPPPPTINTVPPDPAPGVSTRQRFMQHESDPVCAVCHTMMDPIGFGLESYDALGAFRTMDTGQAVDASGQLTRTDVDGPFTGAVALAGKLAASNQVRVCVAHQWFEYAFGRNPGLDDACSYWAGYNAFRAADYNVRDLLIGFVSSDAFRYRRSP